MRKTQWLLLTGSLLLCGLLATANPASRSSPVFLGLEGSITASELYATPPGDPTPLDILRKNPSDPLPWRDRDVFVLPPRDSLRVGFEILVDGRPLRTVSHAGRTYVPVPRLGTEYEIRVWNDGPRRITAIVSVDGLSVINGRPASEDDPGYIVAANSDIRIKGWRRDLDTVAAFSFENREKSYASRMGYPDNIGVIGLVAIEEMSWRSAPLLERKESIAPTFGKTPKDVGGTGTGYGHDVDSRTYRVPFVSSNNKRTVTLYYDTVSALRNAGVPVDDTSPVPFPRDKEFAPPPPALRTK